MAPQVEGSGQEQYHDETVAGAAMESMGLMLARALAESWNRRWEEEEKSFLLDMAMAKIDARARAQSPKQGNVVSQGEGGKEIPIRWDGMPEAVVVLDGCLGSCWMVSG